MDEAMTPRKLDLAAIAEGIETPYRPVPLATLGSVEVALFICQGQAPWRRRFTGDELLFVLEGVITLEDASGKIVVNEGEVASAPGERTYNAHSGMRSSVVLFEDHSAALPGLNGHEPLDPEEPEAITKVNAAIDVRRRPSFEWLAAGGTGLSALRATRLAGTSASYQVEGQSALLLVYRGVLDYRVAGQEGSIVGSNMLVVPPGSEMTLSSQRGATLLFLAPSGAPLPTRAAADPAGPDADSEALS